MDNRLLESQIDRHMTGGPCLVPMYNSIQHALFFFGQWPRCLTKIKTTAALATVVLLPDNYWPISITILNKVIDVIMTAHYSPNFKNSLG